MFARRDSIVVSALLVAMFVASCRPMRPAAPPLPEIPIYVITPVDSSGMTIAPARSADALSRLGAAKRVSLTSTDANARTLLLWLAQEAGISLVVAPDVNARVSVSFNNVPANEALRAVIAEAGLSLLAPGSESPWPPVVFFQLPMNINELNADAIVARFGVSEEMAKWIVESRPKQ
jgi:hypothetical protein